jgi:hypothetical protein
VDPIQGPSFLPSGSVSGAKRDEQMVGGEFDATGGPDRRSAWAGRPATGQLADPALHVPERCG